MLTSNVTGRIHLRYFKRNLIEQELDPSDLVYDSAASSCEKDKEVLGSVKSQEFLLTG
jgi:hypothetical protein